MMKRKPYTRWMIFLGIFIFVLVACQSATPKAEAPQLPTLASETEKEEAEAVVVVPSVTVTAQEITDGTVTIASVVSDGPGWLVIHAQADGKPGPILGKSPVAAGENMNVRVEIDLANATETLYAMLHIDAGEVGTFEFPGGSDGPVMIGDKVVTPAFTVTGLEMAEDKVTPVVSVVDQEITDGSVTIASVVSDGPGWLVIHAQSDGKPGPILGMTAVTDGTNTDVLVEVDPADATEILYAMLHTDAGEVGTFEFPDGPDGPVIVDEKVITPPFKVLAKEMPAVNDGALVLLSEDEGLGPILTDATGMTLYIFANDEPGVSNCYDQCATNWPPLLLEDGQSLTGGEGLVAELQTTERTDGGLQVTYNGWPLYTWINDAEPGDTSGHGVGGVWAVAGLEPAVVSIVPGESQVSYEVEETFLGENRFNVAVGVTPQITGKILGDLTNPRSVVLGPVAVDISLFQSDSDRRDNKIRNDFLESAKYPVATFMPTQIEGLPVDYIEGEPVTLLITGDLTVKETTKPVTFEVTAQLVRDSLTGEATATILMSDFGIGPISILGMIQTEDEVKIDFNFAARP